MRILDETSKHVSISSLFQSAMSALAVSRWRAFAHVVRRRSTLCNVTLFNCRAAGIGKSGRSFQQCPALPGAFCHLRSAISPCDMMKLCIFAEQAKSGCSQPSSSQSGLRV